MPAPAPFSVARAATLDAALVIAFVLIGRRSHDEGVFSVGTLHAIWPFLLGLSIGWMLSRAWRNPTGLLLPGVVIWLSTVAVGMGIRMLSGQGVQPSFVLVATVVTGVFLLGWRFGARKLAQS